MKCPTFLLYSALKLPQHRYKTKHAFVHNGQVFAPLQSTGMDLHVVGIETVTRPN
jgi:hypothetical protein